jgi:hypothetical protein
MTHKGLAPPRVYPVFIASIDLTLLCNRVYFPLRQEANRFVGYSVTKLDKSVLLFLPRLYQVAITVYLYPYRPRNHYMAEEGIPENRCW